jgi:exodeoxyribonuclease X
MLIVLDTETTGLAPPEAEVIELAAVRLCRDEFLAGGTSALIRPKGSIPPETSAVHHLTIEDFLIGDAYETLADAWRNVVFWGDCEHEPVEAFVAHNAEYDRKFLDIVIAEDIPWLCTYRCARHLYPEAPGFGNQTLRYYLGLKPMLPPGLAPHRALYDTIVTAEILQYMLKMKDLEELLVIQHNPVLIPKIPFGKHRGKQFRDIPKDYLEWVVKQDFDADVKHTAKHWLNGG